MTVIRVAVSLRYLTHAPSGHVDRHASKNDARTHAPLGHFN